MRFDYVVRATFKYNWETEWSVYAMHIYTDDTVYTCVIYSQNKNQKKKKIRP